MASEIHALIARFAREEKHKLHHQVLAPWLHFNSTFGVQCKDFYGKNISYRGILFSGSARDVFWGSFIGPYLEDITERGITFACREAIERHLSEKEPLADMVAQLKAVARDTYEHMADIDQRLRAVIEPGSKPPRRKVDAEIAVMEKIIEDRAAVELKASKAPRPEPWWKVCLKALPLIGAVFKALWGT